jgi:hypothetical protein
MVLTYQSHPHVSNGVLSHVVMLLVVVGVLLAPFHTIERIRAKIDVHGRLAIACPQLDS